jgi:hypothetical protein
VPHDGRVTAFAESNVGLDAFVFALRGIAAGLLDQRGHLLGIPRVARTDRLASRRLDREAPGLARRPVAQRAASAGVGRLKRGYRMAAWAERTA